MTAAQLGSTARPPAHPPDQEGNFLPNAPGAGPLVYMKTGNPYKLERGSAA